MKTSYKKISIIFSVLLLLYSCSESLLDNGQKGVTLQADFYKTDNDALQGAVAVYEVLQNYYIISKLCLSDDVVAGGGARADNVFFEELNEFRFTADNLVIARNFELLYRGIYLANKVIDLTDNSSIERKRIIAEAKTLRAFFYFDLVTMWKNAPLVLHELAQSEYAQPAATSEAIWAQIKTDLTDAIAVLPLKSQQTKATVFRTSKGAAQSLLGKAYLYQKKYDEAAVQFEEVIKSGEYSLYADYSRILRANTEFGTESVLEIPHTAQYWPTVVSPNSGLYEFALMGPRADFFKVGTTGLLGGWGFCVPSKSIYQAYLDAGDNVRITASIMTEAQVIAAGGSLRKSGALAYGNEGFVRLKYGTWADETVLPLDKFSYGTNYRLMRYADVLLMAAEAYNKKGDDSKALQYVNLVRKRVSLPDLTETGTALFEKLKLERRLELSFEGFRYQDLVRWGDAPTVLANQGKLVPKGNGDFFQPTNAGFKSYNILLPIPTIEMRVNPNLTQNTGY